MTLVAERVRFVRGVCELVAEFRYELQRVDQELASVRQSSELLAQLDDLEAFEDMDEKIDELKVCSLLTSRCTTAYAKHCAKPALRNNVT